MSDLAGFGSNRHHMGRVLCLVAVTMLSSGMEFTFAGVPPTFRAPRIVRGFLPPPAPPVLTVQPTPQPKPQLKTAPVPRPVPAPAAVPQLKAAPPAPGWSPRTGAPSAVAAVRLYRCVKYKDTDEVPKDAIPLVIQVPDPRGIPSWIDSLTPAPLFGCAYPRGCAYPVGCAYPAGCARPMGPRMVSIKICAPACAVECLRVGQHVCSGRRIRYNFGDYKVDIRLRRNGWIEVDYQDDD